jgi:hypothetical protein
MPEPDTGKKKNFFETTAGIISGITALLVAITGLIGALNKTGCSFSSNNENSKNNSDTPKTEQRPVFTLNFEGRFITVPVSSSVEKFGGGLNASGIDYCVYTCTYHNLVLRINFDNSTSSFESTYESDLFTEGCAIFMNPEDKPYLDEPIGTTQKCNGESESFNLDKTNKIVNIAYNVNFPIVLSALFNGEFENSKTIKGSLTLTRQDYKGFKGYSLKIPLTLYRQ